VTALEALERPAAWGEFLDQLLAATGCRVAFLWTFYPDAPDYREQVVAGLSPAEVAEYRRDWAGQDPWLAAVDLHRLPVGQLVRSEHLCTDEYLDQTESYQKFYRRVGYQVGMGGRLSACPHQGTGLTIGRPRSEGRFTEEEMAWMGQLFSGLCRIAGAYDELAMLRLGVEGTRRISNRASDALLIVSAHGRVIFKNLAAEELLERRRGLRLNGGALEAEDGKAQAALRAAIQLQAGLVANTPEQPPTRLALPRAGGERPLFVIVEPARAADNPAATPAAGLTVIDPSNAWSGLDPAILCQAFGLSPSEARLVGQLAAGLTPREAAAELNVTLGTVRAQLHSMFTKTGTGRQAELLQLALRVAGRQAG